MTKNDEVVHSAPDDMNRVGEFYVFRSPVDGHGAVAQFGAGGTFGWAQLHGPDSFAGCWNWIRSNCTGGPNYFIC
jgi:hypothetical protein